MSNNNEVNVFDLLAFILKYIKAILISILFTTSIVFCFTKFIIPKEFTATTYITIMPNNHILDYTPYLNGTTVIDKISSSLKMDYDDVFNSIKVKRDMSNPSNYYIEVTTRDTELSCKIANIVVSTFETTFINDLGIKSVVVINEAKVSEESVKPNVLKVTLYTAFLTTLLSICIIIISFLFKKNK